MALAKATWSRTPDTWKHEYQFIQNKTLISFTDGYKTYLNNTWESVIEPLDSTVFLNKGMDDLTILERKVQNAPTIQMTNDVTFTGTGKMFNTTVDLNKYIDIRSIKTESRSV